jgi:hypothetical protein
MPLAACALYSPPPSTATTYGGQCLDAIKEVSARRKVILAKEGQDFFSNPVAWMADQTTMDADVDGYNRSVEWERIVCALPAQLPVQQ